MDNRNKSIAQWWANYICKKVNNKDLDVSTELRRIFDENKDVMDWLKDK